MSGNDKDTALCHTPFCDHFTLAVCFAIISYFLLSCLRCVCECYKLRINRRNQNTTSAATSSPTPTAPLSISAEFGGNGSANIPSFVYSSPLAADGNVLDCAVCLEKFKDGEKGRLLMVCGHSFHAKCIDEWFKSHSTCPSCRANVDFTLPA